ncbi:peptide chain release factor N(5)-glutamine methyltransferase [Pseudotenacibaculum sp. MALMAid0570]|uniref:peptide chain release factor N(5)-glutamine methyltransferase n=1 Tax=Pseudotenacibaculum sp. MALMAid0570 TaxID=3143938 RepID=UPI0032DEACD6
MTLKEFQHHFTSELSSLYPKTEVDSFLSILIEEYLNLQRIDLVLKPTLEIPHKKLKLFNIAIQQLQKEEPIQYIIGKTEFFGFPFYVNEDVLIPRPETEELVEWVISEAKALSKFKPEEPLNILDIGTGSGCIPISLKKHLPKANISAIDISQKALETAKNNATLNNVEINFIEKDILNTRKLGEKYDIIISNPPYVRELEKVEIKNNVLENEPHLALFVGDDNPLVFYHKISELAKENLKENGILFFEINQYLGKEMLDLMRLFKFKNVLLKKDLFGKDRMIKATV